MAETIDFAATIASLQEQIDTLNGELAGHRKLISTGDIDTFWLLFGGVLVFWMQAGFAMLEVGSVQIKNTKNILIKNVFDASIGALCWWFTGFGIALGSGGDGSVAGSDGYGLDIDPYSKATWLFQWSFAAAAATIVSGAVAERVSFGCYIEIGRAHV